MIVNLSVINIKNKDNSIEYIYIGRQNKTYNLQSSILANPFLIGKDGTRQEVIEKYRNYLWYEIKNKTKIYDELYRITKLVKEGNEIKLACWCKPEACHGDIIINVINWMISGSQMPLQRS